MCTIGAIDPVHWSEDEYGLVLFPSDADHPVLRIEPTGPAAWRLISVKRSGWTRTLWSARTAEECLEWSNLISSFDVEAATYRERIVSARGERLPSKAIHGAVLSVISGYGTDSLYVAAHLRGVEIGRSMVWITPLGARYVIGEPSISGDALVREEFRGKGLGSEIYDLQERLSGLPRVPHNLNGNVGSLSLDAQVFWERRSSSRRVPGMDGDPLVIKRLEDLRKVRELDMDVAWHGFSPCRALAIHEIAGWPLEAAFDKNGSVMGAWCITGDGYCFNAMGKVERNEAIRRLRRSLGHSVRLRSRPVGVNELGVNPDLVRGGRWDRDRMKMEVDMIHEWHVGVPLVIAPTPDSRMSIR